MDPFSIMAITSISLSLISGVISIGSCLRVNASVSSNTNDTVTLDIKNSISKDMGEYGPCTTKSQEIHIKNASAETISRELNVSRTGMPNKVAERVAGAAEGATSNLTPSGKLASMQQKGLAKNFPLLSQFRNQYDESTLKNVTDPSDYEEKLPLLSKQGQSNPNPTNSSYQNKDSVLYFSDSSDGEVEDNVSTLQENIQTKHHLITNTVPNGNGITPPQPSLIGDNSGHIQNDGTDLILNTDS